MARLRKIINVFLISWGLFCVVSALALAGYLTYWLNWVNVPKQDVATKHDVRFVLNWSGLGEERIEEVEHSYVSGHNITGDHLDAYVIRISHVDVNELMTMNDRTWTRCDEATGVLLDAIQFAAGWLYRDDISWFLTSKEIGSAEVYVYPSSITLRNGSVDSIQLIFVKPTDNMVYYMSSAV